MQILSDVLGEKLYLSEQADGCCFGAYSVAKKGETGEFERFTFTGKTVEPNKQNNILYESKFINYNKLLSTKQKF
jgi:sugar (pentulose or hexulose) kinase